MIPPPDDFNPDAHPPINRSRCLALKWFDDDPMPSVCKLQPGHSGRHEAMTQARTVAQAWDDDETMGDVA